MVRRRFTPAEIASFQVAVVEGASVTDLCKQHGFSTATSRRWARTYGTPFFPYAPSDLWRTMSIPRPCPPRRAFGVTRRGEVGRTR